MEKGYIYRLTSPSEKHYVGQTVNFKKRMSEYKTFHHCENQCALFNAIKKYGFENFEIKIIETINRETKELLQEELNLAEIFYIDMYDCVRSGYNISYGGNQHRLGVKETEEQKQKKRDRWTDEMKKEQSEKWKGDANPRKGKKFGTSPHAKPVNQYTLDNEFIQQHESLTKAGENVLSVLGKPISFKNISKCCHGETKQCGGYIWKF